MSDRLALSVRGDVGGFGIGSASDLTWQVLAGLHYRLSERISILAGYKYYNLDYRRGDLEMDMEMKGPITGVAIHF
ncbi:hypothetical protein HQ576_03540 [bacterium]|nr:hypothetical protein [bacterium]